MCFQCKILWQSNMDKQKEAFEVPLFCRKMGDFTRLKDVIIYLALKKEAVAAPKKNTSGRCYISLNNFSAATS